MGSEHPLWTLSDAEVGAYYEARVLDWFGWDAGSAPVNELASAYRQLSERLVTSAGGPPSGRHSGAAELAVRALVYGWRSVFVARRFLRGLRSGERVVELGSGIGPFGLVAAAAGAPVLLVDAAVEVLDAAPGYFEAFGLGAPDVRRSSLERATDEAGCWVLPYSALEWAGDDPRRRRTIADWFRTRRVLLVERGTKEGGHFVQALRDEVGGVGGPCPARTRCALDGRPRDWCHFTWPTRPGPLTQRIADKAARKWNVVHLSWLASGPIAGPGHVRLLSVRPEGRHKRVAMVCAEAGIERWVAEKRDKAAFRALENLESGALLADLGDAGVRRGDGLRVQDAGAVVPVAVDGDRLEPTSSRPVDDL